MVAAVGSHGARSIAYGADGMTESNKDQGVKILAVAAKSVGLACVRYLTERFPEDDYTFIVGEPDGAEIEAFLKETGYSYSLLTDEGMKAIAAGGAGQYDWLLNLWGNHIYRKDMLAVAKASLNIHPSFLPFGRGRDPIVWTIQRSWPAGASLHAISEGIDEGPIWARKEVSYAFPCRGKDLYDRVIATCIELFAQAWPSIRAGEIKPETQETGTPTNRRRQLLEDRVVSLEPGSPIHEFLLRVLSHDFSPDYTAQITFGDKRYRLTFNIEEVDDPF